MEAMTHSSTFLLPSLPPPEADGPSQSYALVALNQSLPRFTPLLWSREQHSCGYARTEGRIGFTTRFLGCSPIRILFIFIPDVIKGDMDSIRAEVKEFYSDLGVKIMDESHDQDTTDLHKCVAYISGSTTATNKSNICILVMGALGGRFDHELGNINVLHRFSNIRIILLSDDCLIYLLPKTHSHEILIHSSVEGPHCGLIPVGAPSTSTSTTGLKWNLNETGMRFGDLISTSNIVLEEKVTVRSDSDLIWTISIQKSV